MATVDRYITSLAGQQAHAESGTGGLGAAAETDGQAAPELFSTSYGETFKTAAELRAHCKTERHVYNTKRKLAGLKPISQEAWERKLKEASLISKGPKKTDHIKAGKEKTRKGGSGAAADIGAEIGAAATEASAEGTQAAAAKEVKEEEPWTPCHSLFDRKKFNDMETCLKYMWRTYNFYIPDREYCINVEGLLRRTWEKINTPPHICIFCNRIFPDPEACRKHMIDKRHARIGTQARTRSGKLDERGSKEMKEDLEPFYDFTPSILETTENIKDSGKKVGCIVRFWDVDKDGRLDRDELEALWKATSTSETSAFSDAMYAAACDKLGVSPKEGLDEQALQKLYSAGLADLDRHFGVLQELLTKKLSERSRFRRIVEEDDEDVEDGEGEGEKKKKVSEKKKEKAPPRAKKDGEEEDGSSSDDENSDADTEVLECDDEEEFDEVMRVLGLKLFTVTEDGDLQLPSGAVAANRDVAHIWKQRGIRGQPNRLDQLALATPVGDSLRGRPRPKAKQQLQVLGMSSANVQVAVSARARAKEGKKFVAYLIRQQYWETKQGIRASDQQRKGAPVRTAMGDASGGR